MEIHILSLVVFIVRVTGKVIPERLTTSPNAGWQLPHMTETGGLSVCCIGCMIVFEI